MASGDAPNFLMQTLGPQFDASAQAAQQGYQHGTRLLEAAKQRAFQAGETAKAQAWQSEQDNLQRELQVATTTFGAQQNAAQAGVQPGQVPHQFASTQDPLNTQAGVESHQRDIRNVSTAQPLALGRQSDAIYSGAMGALGQTPGAPGGQAGPPDMSAGSSPRYLQAAEVAGQRAQVQRLMPGASAGQQDSLAPYAKTEWSKEASAATPDHAVEVANIRAKGAVDAAKARPRPRGGSGGTELDDLKTANADALKTYETKAKAQESARKRLGRPSIAGMDADPTEMEARATNEMPGLIRAFGQPAVNAAAKAVAAANGGRSSNLGVAQYLINTPLDFNAELSAAQDAVHAGRQREGFAKPAPHAPTSGPGSPLVGNPIRNFMLQNPGKYGDPQALRAIMVDPKETPERKAWAQQSYADGYEKARADLAGQQQGP